MEKHDSVKSIHNHDSGSAERLKNSMEIWLEEIAVNSEMYCPVQPTKESPLSPLYLTGDDGKQYLIVLTDYSIGNYPYFVKVSFNSVFKVVMHTDNCAGIAVDPGKDVVFISKRMLEKAIGNHQKKGGTYEIGRSTTGKSGFKH